MCDLKLRRIERNLWLLVNLYWEAIMLRTSATLLTLLACASGPADAQQLARQAVGPELSFPAGALQGASRKIMRLSDGKIHLSLLSAPEAGSQIKLFSTTDRKQSWDDVTGRELSAVKARSVNSDTGPSGTFVSFISGTTNTGEILLFPDPVGNPGRFVRYAPLTRATDQLSDGFVAASKGDESTNSVAYGWRDAERNALLVGYSADGRQFPESRPLVADQFLRSGPQIAVHNRYILVSYLSADPRYRPRNDSAEARAYPVFIESWDGGQNWSTPSAIFGTELTRFPKVDYAQIGARATDVKGNLLAAGGSQQAANALAWPQAGIGARIFILNEQALVSSDPAVNARLQATPVNVGVLAFKDLSDGPQATWNTVVASAPPQTRADLPTSTDFQYSALPGTSIRAVAYRRSYTQQARETEGIVVSISTNTGQSFDRSVFVSKAFLGLTDKTPLIFTTSACVYKNEKGDLFLDVAYLDAGSKVQSTQVALDFNLSQLPVSMFNVVAKWP